MKRMLTMSLVAAMAVGGMAGAASAEPPPNQPSQGDSSIDRNLAGVGGGPHCHVLVVDNAQERFTIRVFPSHTGHVGSGTVDGVFAADGDCDGVV